MKKLIKAALPLLAICAVALPTTSMAQDAAPEISGAEAMFTVNNTWMMVATFLVFIMHLGFACVETGLTRAKNTVNILFKNTAIVSIGLLTYALMGFNMMYPGDFNGYFAPNFVPTVLEPVGLSAEDAALDYASVGSDFFFQLMFCATTASIVSGTVPAILRTPSLSDQKSS